MSTAATVDINQIVGSRVRVQRLSDARLFSGWVDTAAGQLVHLALSQDDDLAPGENVFCEAHTFSARVNFKAAVERRQPMGETCRYVLRLNGNLCVAAGAENPRFRVPSTPMRLTDADGRQAEGRMLDVSVTGMGANLDIELVRGTTWTAQIQTIFGNVTADVEVRYCRSLGEDGEYRAGLQIQSMDRDSAGTWVRFVRAVACGERSAA